MTMMPWKIATKLRTTAILLALLFSTAWAQNADEGASALDEGNYQAIFEATQSVAEEGNAKAQYTLGDMYRRGLGVSQNYSKAARWYRAAAEQGHAVAQNDLGVMYRNGEGVPQDDSEAVRWYRAVLSSTSELCMTRAEEYLRMV
jgi:TPR repeat protein